MDFGYTANFVNSTTMLYCGNVVEIYYIMLGYSVAEVNQRTLYNFNGLPFTKMDFGYGNYTTKIHSPFTMHVVTDFGCDYSLSQGLWLSLMDFG